MGTLFFFDEAITLDDNPRVRCTPQQVEVLDNHSVPEIVIGPVGEASDGVRATFNDWDQFVKFADAVEALRSRLGSIATET